MSKVVILWFNFSSSTSYPHGPVSSGLSLYTTDLVDKDIGHQHSICNCCYLSTRSINVTNRRNTYLDIKNIRTHDGKSAVNEDSRLLKIEIFYRLLKQTIKEHYNQTFDFEDKNMAVLVNEDERFDALKILEEFKAKLCELYKFDAPIAIDKVNEEPKDAQDIDIIPFINKEDDNISRFIGWVSSVCPSL
jgi:hypothetical protein